MKWLGIAARWLFLICIPLFLLTTTLRWGTGEIRLYQYGFDKYDVARTTGLDEEELSRIARELIRYFHSSEEEPFQVSATRNGEEFALFTPREIAHLRDVKGLIQLNRQVQESVLVVLLLYCAGGFILRRRDFWREIVKAIQLGSGLTILLIFLLAAAALLDFERLFLQFHLISFSNFLWILDPSDYLLKMFPEGFFRDATLLGVLAITIEAALLGGIASIVLIIFKGRGSAAGSTTGGGATAARAA
jgi:integral membrane protein (TIGR01906 family)